MNIKRLKFAQARGARIEHYGFHDAHAGQQWMVCPSVAWLYYEHYHSFRVHPDDAHLEYGDVARTALSLAQTMSNYGREDERYTDFTKDWPLGIMIMLGAGPPENDMTIQEKTLYLLFLAEFLADEGL